MSRSDRPRRIHRASGRTGERHGEAGNAGNGRLGRVEGLAAAGSLGLDHGGIDLPDLQVVALDQLTLHEHSDERRVVTLCRRIRDDGRLKNPPLVTHLDDDRYVVLDGANRTEALRSLGVPHVVVQVVDYDEAQLSTWRHAITGIASSEFLEAIEGVEGLAACPAGLDEARAAMATRQSLAYAATACGVLSLRGSGSFDGGTRQGTRLLCEVVGAYTKRGKIVRVPGGEFEALCPFLRDMCALVVFPQLERAEILALALRSERLPSGVTRHRVPCRAVGIDAELSFLLSTESLADKNYQLQEWTLRKLSRGRIRLYEEYTVSYNE